MSHNRSHTSWWAVAAVTTVLLTGCSVSEASEGAGSEAAHRSEESHESHESHEGTHTMPDGTVMNDSEMSGATEPSPAAEMVCSGDVVDDVTRLLGLPSEPDPVASWSEPMFTCTFELDGGPLVLSVHDATDPKAGREFFDGLRVQLGETEELRGMYGFGLPAYETDDGTVVFIKDGKTLQVDATALPSGLGPDGSMDQGDLAYAVASSVLTCWTDHT